ncbi:hypothetical protein GZ77_08295 [Endozoicomonas montiporae]|uniref:Uncharacterized protein n=2 Tax=Endozoicomonas montiporae TaxID=1027273 RepID=A0A081N7F3_9GAMM|nr:hypothetical protein [Endozoicomonas montiporae]AMO55782.1 hypothetical protein EZMO1_1630 [Endozoicomonas montiporae CL-33]KEQ14376.1 hypothetical protein GZ77_08295 [Endozoicomonas montiporae]
MGQGISAGATGFEHFYPGMDKVHSTKGNPESEKFHTIDRKGEFNTRAVTKSDSAYKKLPDNRDTQLKKVQDQTQKSVYDRRIEIIQQHGNFQKTTQQLNTNTRTGRNGTLPILDDKGLQEDIAGIKSIAKDKLAGKAIGNEKDNKVVVSEEGLKARAQKDLTIFFTGSIKEANQPQTLQTLNHFIATEAESDSITPKQHQELKSILKKQCQRITKALPKTLKSFDITRGSKADFHQAEMTKLQYLHDLQSMLGTVAPRVLKDNESDIRQEAVSAFITGKNHLEPSSKSFRETHDMLEGIESDKQELLLPILSSTTKEKKFAGIIEGVNSNISLTVSVMERQLSENETRINALQSATNLLTEHQRELGQLTRQLKGAVRNIESRESNYQMMRANAGSSKIKRFFNISYQFARRHNRKEKALYETHKTELQQTIKDKQEQIQSSKREYTYQRMELGKVRKQFSDSMEVAPNSAVDPRSVVGNSGFDAILVDLEKQGIIEESDVSSAHQIFSQLSDNAISDQAVEQMAQKYRQLVEERGYDSYQALWAISSGYSSSSRNLDSDFDQEIEFLESHANLTPARKATPKAQEVRQPAPLHMEVASRLAEASSQNVGWSQTGVIQDIERAVNKNPHLQNEIGQICDFFLDGVNGSSKAFENYPQGFNKLFVEHYYKALDIGIKALEGNASVDDAISQMADHLKQREAELDGTTDVMPIDNQARLERAARLAEINPDHVTTYSNMDIARFIEDSIELYPHLEADINQAFDNYLDYLKADQPLIEQDSDSFNSLFTNYYSALGVSIEELKNGSSSEVAQSQMMHYMDRPLPPPPPLEPASTEPQVASIPRQPTSNSSTVQMATSDTPPTQSLVKPSADALQAEINKRNARRQSSSSSTAGSAESVQEQELKQPSRRTSFEDQANRPGSPMEKMIKTAQDNAPENTNGADETGEWEDN